MKKLKWLVGFTLLIAALALGGFTYYTRSQKAVFLKVYLDEEGQTVRGLASYANISKPAITRALDRLAVFDLIRRRTDPNDRRSVIVQRTAQGRIFFRKMGDIVLDANRRMNILVVKGSSVPSM